MGNGWRASNPSMSMSPGVCVSSKCNQDTMSLVIESSFLHIAVRARAAHPVRVRQTIMIRGRASPTVSRWGASVTADKPRLLPSNSVVMRSAVVSTWLELTQFGADQTLVPLSRGTIEMGSRQGLRRCSRRC